ncbi:MAG TPA: hypothetical protein VN512_13175 [Clostridia bacterium]|nr:hypothetical protein [Clostridia bacterium]
MSTKMYTISEFKGIDQSKSENLLNPSYSPDACNMDTEYGDLKIAKGYEKFIEDTFQVKMAYWPPTKLYVWRRKEKTHIIVTLYRDIEEESTGRLEWGAYDTSADTWVQIGGINIPLGSKPKCNFLEAEINGKDYLIIGSGAYAMAKWGGGAPGEEGSISAFGSLAGWWTIAAVASYADKVITLNHEITQHQANRLVLAGVRVKNTTTHYDVESVDVAAKTITLKTIPGTAPASGDSIAFSGGASQENTHLLAMHYGRLFAAGNIYDINPCRLYWSQVPGDYRSIEDWTADDASPDTGGGFVDVGSQNDPIVGLCAMANQLLIFKRDSLYRLLGDRPSNFRIYKVNAEIEEMMPDSVIAYGDTPTWMTKAGMYYFDGQTARRMPNADYIKKFLSGIDLSNCKGAENRDKLYFTAREGVGNVDNSVIVYDVLTRTYMIRRGFNVVDMFGAGGILYMINDAGFVYKMETGDTYDGQPIEAYWNTPISDLNGKMENKQNVRMYLRGSPESEAPVLIEAYVGKYVTEKRVPLPCSEYEVYEVPLANEARVVSFKFSNEAGGYWELKGGVQVEFSVSGGAG